MKNYKMFVKTTKDGYKYSTIASIASSYYHPKYLSVYMSGRYFVISLSRLQDVIKAHKQYHRDKKRNPGKMIKGPRVSAAIFRAGEIQ